MNVISTKRFVSRFGLVFYFIAGLAIGTTIYSAVVTWQRAQWEVISPPIVCGSAFSACV